MSGGDEGQEGPTGQRPFQLVDDNVLCARQMVTHYTSATRNLRERRKRQRQAAAEESEELEVALITSGVKFVEPSGSPDEAEMLRLRLEALEGIISAPRVNARSQLSEAVWEPGLRLARMVKPVGKHWETIGHFVTFDDSQQMCLFPEEFVFLMESNNLEVTSSSKNGVPLSLQAAYDLMLGSGVSLEHFTVYSHLSRLGYKVVRHNNAEKLPSVLNIRADLRDKNDQNGKPEETWETQDDEDIEVVEIGNDDREAEIKGTKDTSGAKFKNKSKKMAFDIARDILLLEIVEAAVAKSVAAEAASLDTTGESLELHPLPEDRLDPMDEAGNAERNGDDDAAKDDHEKKESELTMEEEDKVVGEDDDDIVELDPGEVARLDSLARIPNCYGKSLVKLKTAPLDLLPHRSWPKHRSYTLSLAEISRQRERQRPVAAPVAGSSTMRPPQKNGAAKKSDRKAIEDDDDDDIVLVEEIAPKRARFDEKKTPSSCDPDEEMPPALAFVSPVIQRDFRRDAAANPSFRSDFRGNGNREQVGSKKRRRSSEKQDVDPAPHARRRFYDTFLNGNGKSNHPCPTSHPLWTAYKLKLQRKKQQQSSLVPSPPVGDETDPNKDDASDEDVEVIEDVAECLSKGPLGRLWNGRVLPLVKPSDAKTTTSLMSKLREFDDPPSSDNELTNKPSSDTEATNNKPSDEFGISYDVYLPKSKFKKSVKLPPDYRVVVCSGSDSNGVFPSFRDVARVTGCCRDKVPVLFAISVLGSISFYCFSAVDLPTLISVG